MIIKGQSISSWKRHATHLLKENKAKTSPCSAWNDIVELVCCHNTFTGNSVQSALREMSAVAVGSKCTRWLYTASISPSRAGGRELSNEEAEYSAQKLLDSLGFQDEHQWFAVRHVKAGRAHFHICANRVHPQTLHAVHLGWNYIRHEEVARHLEVHFQLRPIKGAFTRRKRKTDEKYADQRPVAYQSTAEAQQAQRTGISVDTVIADLSAAWEDSRNGREFDLELLQRGYVLARGGRRALVVVDKMGGVHSPTRRLGIKTAEFQRRMVDLDISDLPNLDALRNEQRRVDRFQNSAHEDNKRRPERKNGNQPSVSLRNPGTAR